MFALALANAYAATGPLAMVSFRNEYGVRWPEIGAAALIISTPVVLFAVVMQRLLVARTDHGIGEGLRRGLNSPSGSSRGTRARAPSAAR